MHRKISLFRATLAFFLAASAQAQHDNPTGPAGAFGSVSNTGGSYSPYTANATRGISDISVSGGASPLQWSRIMNTRQGGSGVFGAGGGWTHSYNWRMDWSEEFEGPNPGMPSSYSVYFPDGRYVSFYNTLPSDPGYFHGPAGVGERFQQLQQQSSSSGTAWLVLTDGSKVDFKASRVLIWDPDIGQYRSYWSYTAWALIDPNGLRTTFTYSGSNLWKVTEPAGRYLQLTYTSGRISRVDAKYGGGTGVTTQSVTYGYATQSFGGTNYTVLTSANYITDPGSPSATYTYQTSNLTANGVPLINTCSDLHYGGPMKSIAYDFERTAGTRFYGQLLREKHVNGTYVATLTISGNTRTETRGDGPSRTFSYGSTVQPGFTVTLPYFLASVTDFKLSPNTAYFSHDPNGYLNKMKNPLGAETSFARLSLTGNLSSVTLPAPAVGGQTSTVSNSYADPSTGYFLSSITNERGFVTSYLRDGSQRVTQVNYPDTGYETFTYNAFNQVLSNRKTTGGTWTNTYDTRGNLMTSKTPYNETTTYGYDVNDRASTVQDPRNNVTNLTYDARGRLTQRQHPAPQFGTTRWQYNTDDTLQYVENELVQRTTYAYDDYKRVISVTNPLNKVATIEYYTPAGGSVYSHTAGAIRKSISPLGLVTGQSFDNNFRVLSVIEAEGTAPATTTFESDPNGNLTKTIDPRGKEVTHTYDNRNRRIKSTKLTQETEWEYDQAGNVTKVTRPDDTTEIKTYDSMNRVLTDKDPLNQITTFTYWASGHLKTVTDPKSQVTQFEYDLSGRKTKMIYPGASPYQEWTYDPASNLLTRRAVNGAVQSFVYDTRNRPTAMSWSNGVDSASYGYDLAGRMTSANNPNSNVTLAYDAAGRLTNDTQNVVGYGTYDVQSQYDDDGRLSRYLVPGGVYDAIQTYDARSRLWKVSDQWRPDMLEYTYDASSNVTQRKNHIGNSTLDFPRDDFNRPERRDLKFGATTISSESYTYELMNRLLTVARTEDSNKSDAFQYDAAGQLTSAKYGLVGGLNPQREVIYTLDGAGNRTQVIDAGATKTYTPNSLNQYTTGHSLPVSNGNASPAMATPTRSPTTRLGARSSARSIASPPIIITMERGQSWSAALSWRATSMALGWTRSRSASPPPLSITSTRIGSAT